MDKTKKELAYIESRTLRDEAVNAANYDFLDKLKAVQYLTDDMVLSVYQVANYYEVSIKSIYTIISRNRDEFEQDGITTLTGDGLKHFKELVNCSSNEEQFIGRRATSLMILTKCSLLRVGLIMTNCAMASKIRNYLLNLEETATEEQKRWAIQCKAGKIERRRMTTAIKEYLPDDEHKSLDLCCQGYFK